MFQSVEMSDSIGGIYSKWLSIYWSVHTITNENIMLKKCGVAELFKQNKFKNWNLFDKNTRGAFAVLLHHKQTTWLKMSVNFIRCKIQLLLKDQFNYFKSFFFKLDLL